MECAGRNAGTAEHLWPPGQSSRNKSLGLEVDGRYVLCAKAASPAPMANFANLSQ